MAIILINRQNAAYRIVRPDTRQAFGFTNGKLVVEDDDPNRDWLLAYAQTDRRLEIHNEGIACPVCYQTFTGQTAKARLAKHQNETGHALASLIGGTVTTSVPGTTIVKGAAEYACDLCNPVQVFEDEEGLAEHTALLHTAKVDEAGD